MHKKVLGLATALLFCGVITTIYSHVVLATESDLLAPQISEIYPDGTVDSSNPSSTKEIDEFIELYNPNDTTISLDGYSLARGDKPNNPSYTWGLDGVELAPRQYKAIVTSSKFALLNSGGTVQLFGTDTTTPIQEVTYSSTGSELSSWSNFPSGWELTPVTKDAENQHTSTEPSPIDICPATPEIDTVIPDGYEVDGSGNCVLIPPVVLCDNQVTLSEFLTDPVGLEANGGEFIELYNPGLAPASLEGCHLKSSKSSADVVTFLPTDIIEPGGYFTVSLTDKLTNASGSISLSTANNDEMVNYTSVVEGSSFALLDNAWQLTNQPTPNAPNVASLQESATQSVNTSSATLADCPEGKYRNPETNRCKNIETASAELTPCDVGQYRNPDTNRCKSITTATASLTPCASDQERNPETNRCRKITTASATLTPCNPGQERNPETNRCRKVTTATATVATAEGDDTQAVKTPFLFDNRIILAVAVGAVGYGVYEYRTDINNLWSRLRKRGGKNPPSG